MVLNNLFLFSVMVFQKGQMEILKIKTNWSIAYKIDDEVQCMRSTFQYPLHEISCLMAIFLSKIGLPIFTLSFHFIKHYPIEMFMISKNVVPFFFQCQNHVFAGPRNVANEKYTGIICHKNVKVFLYLQQKSFGWWDHVCSLNPEASPAVANAGVQNKKEKSYSKCKKMNMKNGNNLHIK